MQPERIWARRAGASGHLVAQVIGHGGQSLFVSTGAPRGRAGSVDLIVIGSRGVMAWESGDEIGEPAMSAADSPSPRLIAALEAALKSSQPVDVDHPAIHAESSTPLPLASRPALRAAYAPVAGPVGVLLVTGNHSHQENYARSFAQDPRCRLIGLTDEADIPARRRELNAQLAAELQIPVIDDFDAAVRRYDVHVISICAAPERRARLIARAAAAGKHLYLDKPLAASVAESQAIVDAVRAAGVNQQMFSLVHTGFAERVRRVVESGELGELVAIHADAFFAKGMPGTADLKQVRRERAEPTEFESIEAKRELHNVGVYSLVQLRWLLGREVRRVFANTCNYFFAEHQRLNMEDYAHVTLELDGGVIATVATGRVGWRSHAMGGINRVTLVGTKRSVCVDWYKPRFEVWADEAPWQLPSRHPEDPMGFWTSTTTAAGAKPKLGWLTPADATNDVKHFVDCVVAGRPSDVSAVDAAAVMEMLMAAYRS
ncbi:MAG: Gfo/Idh/MocA family oxidoreductase, partial [Planctomycetaceae bacterium]|nr:Gfo/Idh/MocA family oxidoreductase [Planctomycetaceae bacterium]